MKISLKGMIFFIAVNSISIFGGWKTLSWNDREIELEYIPKTSESESEIVLACPPQGFTIEKLEFPKPSPHITLSQPSRYRDLYLITLRLNSKDFLSPGRVVLKTLKSPTTVFSTFPTPEKSPSERHLATWIQNYKQSRMWRSRLERPLLKRSGQNYPHTRIVVYTEDQSVYRVSYENLRELGLRPNDIDPRKMSLHHGSREIPIWIFGEHDGKWDVNDYIEFIGIRPEGSFSYHSPYTRHSLLTLTWNKTQYGLRAPLQPVAYENKTPIAGYFRNNLHIENDNEVMRFGGTGRDEVVDLDENINTGELGDFWYWSRIGVNTNLKELEFDVPANPGKDASLSENNGSMNITIGLHGVTDNLKASPDHHLRFFLNEKDISLINGINNDAIWDGRTSHIWKSIALDPHLLKPGKNVLTMQKINDLTTSEGNIVQVQDSYLDYIKIAFPSNYSAVKGSLKFNGPLGQSKIKQSFKISNLVQDEYVLWDLKGRKLTGFDLKKELGAISLLFTDSIPGSTQYLAMPQNSISTPTMLMDTLPELINPIRGTDYLIITHKSLAGRSLDSLIKLKQNQGLTCKTVFTEHIHQLFSDGTPGPKAIRDFVKYAYHYWPPPAPTYLLLLGEASQWFDKKTGDFQKNLVSTNLINIPGWGVTSNDDYFAKVSGNDDIADLIVGRIPVANRADLGKVVYKLARGHERKPGKWKNQTLMFGGYEPVFTKMIDDLSSLSQSTNRQYTKIYLDPASPDYSNPRLEPTAISRMDSAYNLVSFMGHGGGAVWSDAGLLTLQDLEKNVFNGPYPIPLILSLTCLTGYFEDISAKSLGEEIIRYSGSGAINFYGASGYVSNSAVALLSRHLHSQAWENTANTAGAIVHNAETMIRLLTGSKYSPILAEFDLLGDPAFPIEFPSTQPGLSLSPQTRVGNQTTIIASEVSPPNGKGLISVYFADSMGTENDFSFQNQVVNLDLQWENQPPVRQGKAVAHLWDSDSSQVYYGEFTSLDWQIDKVNIQPEIPSLGDSLKISLQLKSQTKIIFKSGIMLWEISGKEPGSFNNPPVNLSSASEGIINAVPVILQGNGNAGHDPFVHIKFRIQAELEDSSGVTSNLGLIESRIFSIPMKSPPDLSFLNSPFKLPYQKNLGSWIRYFNRGPGTLDSAMVAITIGNPSSPVHIDTVKIGRALTSNQADSVFFSMQDSWTREQLTAKLITAGGKETIVSNNQADTIFQIETRTIGKNDSVNILNDTLRVYNIQNDSIRIFFKSLPLNLGKVTAGTGSQFFLATASDNPESPVFLKLLSTTPNGAFHIKPWNNSPWVLVSRGDTLTTPPNHASWYAWFKPGDFTEPNVKVVSQGRKVLPEDFVPRNHPLEFVLRDESGLDFWHRPPQILAGNIENISQDFKKSDSLFPVSFNLKLQPKVTSGKDSIHLKVWDVAGNEADVKFIYKLGEKLSIRQLSGHPNPFADTSTFVYIVTDFCPKLELIIYSRSGRPVRKFEKRNVVGYGEVVWDGHSSQGHEVSNGLYFLKAIAHGNNGRAEQIFKLFKKKHH